MKLFLLLQNFVPATRVEQAQKPAEPEVIVIRSDEESEEVKEKQDVRGRKIRESGGTYIDFIQ